MQALALLLLTAPALADWPGGAYLRGELDATARAARVERWGPELPLLGSLPLHDCVTCAVVGDRLYAGGDSRLHVFDLADPRHPRLLGSSEPFAHGRHLLVVGSTVYVASRADGLFVLDVADPAHPHVVAHYDTIEFATALARSGDVLFVACRQYGVELLDLRDPRHPKHLSTVRTGEAQGMAVWNGIVYVGVWGTRELVVVDARDPARPQVTARRPVDGFANSVTTDGRHVWVACGHHARSAKPAEPGDAAYGHGHGTEVFRLDDPLQPTWVARLKTMPNYRLGPDAWVPKLLGDKVVVADGLGGVYVLDATQPEAPRSLAQAVLPVAPAQGQHDYAHDVAAYGGCFYIAGAFTGLHIMAAPEGVRPETYAVGRPITLTAPEPPPLLPGWRRWRTAGQVWQAAPAGELVAVAAGAEGLVLLRPDPQWAEVCRVPTEGTAVDVRAARGHLWLAEGQAGLRVFRLAGDRPVEVAHYTTDGPVRGVVITPTGHALLHVGDQRFEILDIHDPAAPKRVYACGSEGRGLLYGDQISDDLLADRYAIVAWHVKEPALFDLGVSPPAPAGSLPLQRRGWRGIVAEGDEALCVVGGGLVRVKRGGTEPATVAKDPGIRFEGRAVRAGERLLVWDRASGQVWVVDAADRDAPRVLDHWTFPGNPGRPSLLGERLMVPCGYDGLWLQGG